MIRRHFIRVSSACLALPDLCRAAEKLSPKRLFAIHVPLGMMPQFFFPGKEKRSLKRCLASARIRPAPLRVVVMSIVLNVQC